MNLKLCHYVVLTVFEIGKVQAFKKIIFLKTLPYFANSSVSLKLFPNTVLRNSLAYESSGSVAKSTLIYKTPSLPGKGSPPL